MQHKIENTYAVLHATHDLKSWNVEYGGEVIVLRTNNPRRDTTKYLADHGIVGHLVFISSETGKPRADPA